MIKVNINNKPIARVKQKRRFNINRIFKIILIIFLPLLLISLTLVGIFWNKYVDSDWTFTNMSRKKFAKLQAKMDRSVTYPINYKYKIKNNWKIYPAMVLRQLVLMLVHLTALYMPVGFQKFARKVAGLLRIQSKFVGE